MPTIVPAELHHAETLAPNLRAADVAELAAHGIEPLEGLVGSLEASKPNAWTILDEDKRPIALFGAGDCTDTLGPDVGAPWLLGSDALVTTHRSWFIRNTKRIVTMADHRYSRFFNRVDTRNTLHLRWIRWAGFLVMPAVRVPPEGHSFHPFFRKVRRDV